MVSGLLWMATLAAASVTGTVELEDGRSTGHKHRDYSGVVVWLEPLDPRVAAHLPAPPPARHAEMVQKDKNFIPHVLAIPVGTTVDFPNKDPIFHNAFSSFSGQPFDVGLYPPGTSRSIQFRRDGLVRVFCNIHQAMSAVIVVLKTPWFGVSGANGTFSIDNVPSGEYRLHVFHERASQEALHSLERKVTVGANGVELPRLVISESGYLSVPHKNKYGKEYPPDSGDQLAYPGGKK
jgi:plastocyanin